MLNRYNSDKNNFWFGSGLAAFVSMVVVGIYCDHIPWILIAWAFTSAGVIYGRLNY